jgi:hypothetical protein
MIVARKDQLREARCSIQEMEQSMQRSSLSMSNAWVGALIIIFAIISVFAMMHHPHEALFDGRENKRLQVTHGVLIFTMTFFAFGMDRFTTIMAHQKIDSKLGMLFYYIGLGSMIGAAIISGYLQPALTEAFAANAEAYVDQKRFAAALNQVLASVSICFFGAAGVFLCPGLILSSGKLRLVGLLSLIVGITMIAAMLLGTYLNVFAMTALTVAFVIWHAGIAAVLITRSED